MTLDELKTYIRDIRDFPKPGIVFKDITPLLTSGPAFQEVVDRIASRYRGRVDMVALVRKPGKLPHERYAARYELEYGSDTLEIHRDALGDRSRVLIVDDLLATGGTASAAIELVRRLDGDVVACAFIIELAFLKGRGRLATDDVFSLITYAGE